MIRHLVILAAGLSAAAGAAPTDPPFLAPDHARAIAGEVSGSAAKRTVEALSLHHRMRGSRGYRAAAEIVHDELKAAGLQEVEIIALPADGTQYYGTQRARPAWNARFAELWERRETPGGWTDGERVASWADQPISLAQDSVSGSADAELVDVGAGTAESDFAGKDVRGKFVLTSSQPEAAATLAVTAKGAAGIVSWAQNQKTGWWGEDQSLVRWGHLDTWKDPTFAFMVSPARARAWAARLARGETVRLRARVDAGREPGHYLIPTAIIPGRDRSREIVFSCHLDHPSPGANDNASGCAGTLEAARALNRLIADGRLPRPERTLRFIWPCEVECTIALLNARPEFARRTLATIHLDMIGGDTEITKSHLRVEGSPPSLPTFADDVAFALARWANARTLEVADRGTSDWPLLDPEGSKNPLAAEIGGFSEGSDHTVWAEGSWRIPVVYVADWPDRYIHTQRDVPANLDSTKLKRAIFLAAASGYALAAMDQADVRAVQRELDAARLERAAARLRQPPSEPADAYFARADAGEVQSLERFGLRGAAPSASTVVADGSPTYVRKPSPKGPMSGFGYSWLDDQLERKGLGRPALLDRDAPSRNASFAYEALNLVDGRRSVQAIRDDLTASIGPVPVEEVAAFLATLEQLGLLTRR